MKASLNMLAIVLGIATSTLYGAEPIAKTLSTKLVDKTGKAITVDLTKKKAVVYYFSASWCPPCQKLTPEVVKLYNVAKSKGVEFVLVCWDRDATLMKDYMKKKKVTFPGLKYSEKGSNLVKKIYSGRSIPYLVMMDKTGKKVIEGNGWRVFPKLKSKISKIK